MILKHVALDAHLRKEIASLYVLCGQDQYLINEALLKIKQAWRSKGESDEKIVQISQADDWEQSFQDANSFSLFAPFVLLDLRYEKKTLDAAGKTNIQTYLNNPNPQCLIIIRAMHIPAKQLSWIANHQQAAVIQAIPLSSSALQQWITVELQRKSIRHEPQVPALIHQYGQQNMLACAQLIEKLSLIHQPEHVCTAQTVRDHLIDQCNYSLYDLADACLAADAAKAIHFLRQEHQHQAEPTLILWLLSQEIRQLIQLSQLLNQSITLAAACTQLKIWPQRARLYDMALKRFTLPKLYQLLLRCQQLDEQLKSDQPGSIWQSLEQLALSISG